MSGAQAPIPAFPPRGKERSPFDPFPLWGKAGMGALRLLKYMQNQTTVKARVNARALRRDMTDAERKLWSGLPGEQLGFKFRRQHPRSLYTRFLLQRRETFD